MLLRAAASWLQLSGARCSTSIRLVMKKLFCNAATPFSGRIEVWRHTGHDRRHGSPEAVEATERPQFLLCAGNKRPVVGADGTDAPTPEPR
ncbi:hypothetical protein EYF80_037116 [Liparis tanakae]|uniref:Uncharacterized protein n=1 Tax=Liparis tanakae TaxID=230148 RepID=A0A4Z2GHM9_9TELE|nr:hypothetical protein EYF80_037116 [Liparis tanakae]